MILLVLRHRNIKKSYELAPITKPPTAKSRNIVQPESSKVPQDVITMRIIADENEPYNGYELLQTLLANGLRFGVMNIFHRHEKTNGDGPILFSLAAAKEPGTFDLEKMGELSCTGLTMFMQCKDQQNPRNTLDLVIETAKQLIDDLGGKLIDDQNQPLNPTTIQNWQAQIQAYEENKYSYDLFEQ